MEAARVAAQRGHTVTLFEKECSLGGQLKLAIVPPLKKDLNGILTYFKHQLKLLEVAVNLDRKISPGDLQTQPFDVIIIATGCEPPETPASKYAHAKVVRAWDVLSNEAELTGKRIAVLGNSRVTCETAELLTRRRGKQVTILNPGPPEEMGRNLEPLFEWRLLMERLEMQGVKVVHEATTTKITAQGPEIQRGDKPTLIRCDHLVVDEAPVANQSLLEKLPGKVKKLVGIGDCVDPRDLYHAIHSGFRGAYRID
jgi:pyruvate/2-oxoglutarate dehydrogenase complex dihydrolipoamide dehydrogenase (E3) component